MYERYKVVVDSIMPDFTLKDESGNDRSLREFRKDKKYVVLAFVRGIDDQYTRQELDYLKNDCERFRHLGGDVLAVSTGSVVFNGEMVAKLSLPFHVLSDQDGQVLKMLGIYNQYDRLIGPSIYLLNKAGTVLYMYLGKEPSDVPVNEDIIRAMQGFTQSSPDWPRHG